MGNIYHLNNKPFTKSELITYSENKLQKNDLLSWEKELFSFIIEWFSKVTTIKAKTSGSTGTPKEIDLLKSNMRLSAAKTIHFFKLAEGQNALLCLPVGYIAGKMMVVRAFECGMNLLTIEPKLTLDLSETNTVDFAAMTPHQVKSLISRGLSLDNIRKLIIGGETVGAELSNQIIKSSVEAYESYGMTETMSHVALRKIEATYPTPFKALPGVRFSTDERNCLRIEADFLSKSIQTTDIVELISETSFIYKSRNDFIINSGGIKLNPEKIENDIKKTTGVDIIVSSVPHEKYGEQAILVLSSQPSDEQRKKIQILLASDSKTRFIKNYAMIKNIPKTTNGKTDRIALGQILTDESQVNRTNLKSLK